LEREEGEKEKRKNGERGKGLTTNTGGRGRAVKESVKRKGNQKEWSNRIVGEGYRFSQGGTASSRCSSLENNEEKPPQNGEGAGRKRDEYEERRESTSKLRLAEEERKGKENQKERGTQVPQVWIQRKTNSTQTLGFNRRALSLDLMLERGATLGGLKGEGWVT